MDYQITDKDKAAIVRTAQQLGVTPNELGAVLQRESGINPNIWGGAGGNYYGAIQFGGPERREAGLDPTLEVGEDSSRYLSIFSIGSLLFSLIIVSGFVGLWTIDPQLLNQLIVYLILAVAIFSF